MYHIHICHSYIPNKQYIAVLLSHSVSGSNAYVTNLSAHQALIISLENTFWTTCNTGHCDCFEGDKLTSCEA